MPVDSATTFVRRVLTERSLRTLRPPSFLDSSAVWIALSTCVRGWMGVWRVVSVWALWEVWFATFVHRRKTL